ncbi:MAG: DUF11 domain-containing protein, partial [Chitinophagales bacterium]
MEACEEGLIDDDYSELTPIYPNNGGFTNVSATNLWRDNGKHSCAVGFDGNIALSIGTQEGCSALDYNPTNALKFEVTLNPSDIGQLSSLQFYEKSPTFYNLIGVDYGQNRYPTKYLIRVYKDNQLIYSEEEIPTELNWTLETFDFSNDPDFNITSTSTFRFELRAYCQADNTACESAWNIDDISIKGCTGPLLNSCEITPTVSNIQCNDNGTPDMGTDDTFSFDLTIQGNECSSPDGWEANINGVSVSGDYGLTSTFSGYAISAGNLNFNIEDRGDTDCQSNAIVTAPSPCSNGTDGVDLELTQTVNDPSLSPFTNRIFTVTIENKGNVTANNVTVKNQVPDGMAYTSHSTSKGTYSVWSGVWTIGTLAPGEVVTFDFNLFILNVPGPITNFAQVQTANPDDIDSTPGNDTDNTPDEDDEAAATIGGSIEPTADLTLSKTANVNEANVGDQITYTLVLHNNGPDDATGVTVDVNPPTGISFVNANATLGSYNSTDNTWTLGTVGSGMNPTLTIVVEVTNIDQAITCFAQVATSDVGDPDSTPGNDTDNTPNEDDEASATVEAPAIPIADLSLMKTANVSQANVGDQITYTTTLHNSGPDAATGVSVLVNPPVGVSFVSANASQGTYNSNTNIWTLGTVMSGMNPSLTLVVEVDNIAQAITCFAQVATSDVDDPDSTPGNDTNNTPNEDDEASATVSPPSTLIADLSLSKIANVSEASVGDQITYTTTLQNNGPDTATGVSVLLNPPAGVSFVSSNPSQGTYNNSTNT